jgi:hypothetical protein
MRYKERTHHRERLHLSDQRPIVINFLFLPKLTVFGLGRGKAMAAM